MENRQIFLILISVIFSISLNAQIVPTEFGQVHGSINGTVYQFLGIPFAKPPVNELRWKAPQNPDGWADVLNTTSFAPICPQKAFIQGDTTFTFEGNEDCLYLNVWTPQIGGGNLPVLVFIHGGGNQQGGASELNGGTQMFFGKNMSERGNAVIITIQYRLGPLGFLVHPGLDVESASGISGNFAVLDQILALKWVQNNVAGFGGDPSKVMIFGESAGGVNVGNLLCSPLAAGLFQRACIQSATPVISNHEDLSAKGVLFVDSLTKTGTAIEKISYLRSQPADTIIKNETSPIVGGAVQMLWQAVVDNTIFTGLPAETFQSGNFNKVPLIIGSNSEEMSLSAPPTVYPLLVTALKKLYIPAELLAEADIVYPSGANNEEAAKTYIAIMTDGQFTSNARRTAQCVSQNQTAGVYRYFFTHKHTIALLSGKGSYHGMELFYVFNNWENATLGKGNLFKPQDDSVQKAMLSYWVNFANTGDPNGSGLENWPKYTIETDCYLEIKATPDGSQCGLRTAQTDLWDAVINYIPCTSSVGFKNPGVTNAFIVYPNPANGILKLQTGDEPDFTVSVFNSMSQLVFTAKNQSEIDLKECSNGIYFIVVNAGDQIFKTKIVVMK